MGIRWFALTVKPQHERAVAEQLAAKSLEAYVPIYRSRRWWSDRVKIMELPLFPRYIFCRFALEERVKVLSTPGVISIVSFDGNPYPLDDKEVDAIRRIAESNLVFTPWPFLQIGHRVHICRGPLKGLEGILAKEKTVYLAVVNVHLLQRAVAVEIERDFLQTVPNNGSIRMGRVGAPTDVCLQ